jgi:hypothetical protein
MLFTSMLIWHLTGMGPIPSSYDPGLQLQMSLSPTLLTNLGCTAWLLLVGWGWFRVRDLIT